MHTVVFEIERERAVSRRACDVRQFSSNSVYRVRRRRRRKKNDRERREREREKDRFSLPFFAHFAFLHLLSSRNVLGVTAAVVSSKEYRQQSTHDLCCCCYCCPYYIVKNKIEKEKRQRVKERSFKFNRFFSNKIHKNLNNSMSSSFFCFFTWKDSV